MSDTGIGLTAVENRKRKIEGVNRSRCSICRQLFKPTQGFTNWLFGSVHHQCQNRAEDYVRAMARMNGVSASEYLSDMGRPSLDTEGTPMAQFMKGEC